MAIDQVFTSALLAASLALTPALAKAQRNCSASRAPAQLPAVDAVVDSAALAGLIADAGTRGMLTFSIVADVGETPRVFPNGPASPAAEWLTPRVQAALRDMPKPAVAWGVRLVASADSAPAITLERSEFCPPRSIPSATITKLTIVREPGDPPTPRVWPTRVLRISPDGDVRDVAFIRSSSRQLESELRRVSMSIRYHPARIDGVPVTSADTIGRR